MAYGCGRAKVMEVAPRGDERGNLPATLMYLVITPRVGVCDSVVGVLRQADVGMSLTGDRLARSVPPVLLDHHDHQQPVWCGVTCSWTWWY